MFACDRYVFRDRDFYLGVLLNLGHAWATGDTFAFDRAYRFLTLRGPLVRQELIGS